MPDWKHNFKIKDSVDSFFKIMLLQNTESTWFKMSQTKHGWFLSIDVI